MLKFLLLLSLCIVSNFSEAAKGGIKLTKLNSHIQKAAAFMKARGL